MARSRIVGCLAAGTVSLLIAAGAPSVAGAQPGTGRIVGLVTTSAGEPAVGVRVGVYSPDGQTSAGSATTDTSGAYAVGNLPRSFSQFKVEFTPASFNRQWAHQKRTVEEADSFTVVDGQQTVVDEVLFPTGTLEFTAADKATGAPLNDFCVAAQGEQGFRNGCTTTGRVTLADLLPGNYEAAISPGDNYFNQREPATVSADQTTTVHFELDPAAVITTTVQDAVTKAPVANTCLSPVTGIGGLGSTGGWCSDSSGNVTIGKLATGSYRLYARTNDGIHGAQWVGPRGGTGFKTRAKVINAVAGQTTRVSPILLDKAGAISGTVVDEATGQPVKDVCAFSHAGATTGGPDFAPYCTKEDGEYTISGLGPYLWPVQFIDTIGSHAWQWSGNQPTQLSARLIPVRVGQTTDLDARLMVPATVSGRVTDTNGQPMRGGVVIGYNAVTGDPIGNYTFIDEHGNYRLDGIAGPQAVRLEFAAFSGTSVWYRDASSFQTADPVWVDKGSAVPGIDFVVPVG